MYDVSGTKTIDVGRYFFLMAFNLIGNLMFSRDLLDPNSKRGSEFFYHTGKVMEFAGKANIADFFPLLRFLDPQGIKRKTQFHVERAFEIAGEFIKERTDVRERERSDDKTKDYLDVLLEFRGGDGVDEEPSRFTARDINVTVFVSNILYIMQCSKNSRLICRLYKILDYSYITFNLLRQNETLIQSFN